MLSPGTRCLYKTLKDLNEVSLSNPTKSSSNDSNRLIRGSFELTIHVISALKSCGKSDVLNLSNISVLIITDTYLKNLMYSSSHVGLGCLGLDGPHSGFSTRRSLVLPPGQSNGSFFSGFKSKKIHFLALNGL